jgi:DNA-directed RNA polymerase subunit RPC12/RpoP
MLSDYPRDKWFETADTCDDCGAKYLARVAQLDEDGLFGLVQYVVTHTPDCEVAYDNEGLVDTDLVTAGWAFAQEQFTFLGRAYWPLVERAEAFPCLECGRLIVTVPITVFIERGEKGMLTFCPECTLAIGIDRVLRDGGVRRCVP